MRKSHTKMNTHINPTKLKDTTKNKNETAFIS